MVADEVEFAAFHPKLREGIRIAEEEIRARVHDAVAVALAEAPMVAREYIEKVFEGMEENLPGAVLRGDLALFKLIDGVIKERDCSAAREPFMGRKGLA